MRPGAPLTGYFDQASEKKPQLLHMGISRTCRVDRAVPYREVPFFCARVTKVAQDKDVNRSGERKVPRLRPCDQGTDFIAIAVLAKCDFLQS